jgi:putative acetyltransferase
VETAILFAALRKSAYLGKPGGVRIQDNRRLSGAEKRLGIQGKSGQTIIVAIRVRRESPGDIRDIFNINYRAFMRVDEGRLVDRLRNEVYPFISLVAEDGEGVLAGHILFTPVTVGHSSLRAAGLGPMAVLPERQGTGAGSALIREGLQTCAGEGIEAVFVLGHPEYYTKFGFSHASAKGIYWKSDEFAPYFFVIELVPEVLEGITGEARYHPAFDEV